MYCCHSSIQDKESANHILLHCEDMIYVPQYTLCVSFALFGQKHFPPLYILVYLEEKKLGVF